MPRSERGRVRGNCLQGIALPFLAQAPAADEAGSAERQALVERPRRRAWRWLSGPASDGASGRREPGLEPFSRPLAGLGERSKAVSEALGTVARAWVGAGEMSSLKRGFMGLPRRLEILTGSGGSCGGPATQIQGSSGSGQNQSMGRDERVALPSATIL